MTQKTEVRSDNISTAPVKVALRAPSPAGRCHARLALIKLIAQSDPQARDCRSLSSKEEITEFMAKRYPTLFIS